MNDEELFELVLYLVSCARLSLDEPPIYGSFRLVEGASRLLGTVATEDPFLAGRREEIDREKLRMIDDAAGFEAWLTGFLREIAAEAARRNIAPPT